MAKFKVGDKVKVKGSTKIGTISRINTNFGFDYYWVDGLSDGKNPPVYGESLLSLANSCASTNAVVQNALAACSSTVAKNSFKNPRFIPGLTYDLDELPSQMSQALKKQKESFAHWYKEDVVDGIEYHIRLINDALNRGEGDENEVKTLKEMKPKFEKYLAEAKAVLAKVGAI